MEMFTAVITWLDIITIVFGFITMIFTIWNWCTNRRWNNLLEQDIEIVLKCGEKQYKLPHTVKRRHFTRSEIQGILGNCYQSSGRYNLPYLGKPEYSEAIRHIQNGGSNTLVIPVSDEKEYNNFNPDTAHDIS